MLAAELPKAKLSTLTDNDLDSFNCRASFSPGGGTWQTFHLTLSDCSASFTRRENPGGPPLDPARISQISLMIAERQADCLAFDIRRIRLV